MPDVPSPQDVSETALFSECWDAVLSYADLCTAGTDAGAELAREAFADGIRDLRAAEAATVRGAVRRATRLPRIPLLLTAVRTAVTRWEADGRRHKLDPDLRLWLHSDRAARYTGPPLERPVALRGLRDLPPADAELLWLAEVESLPLPVVARRLRLDPGTAHDELDQVRRQFRDRCHRNHLDSPMDARCRSYARLLDAVTRSPAADTPDDLSRHLATCVRCAEAAACLRLDDGGLPGALAAGVIGWGGPAYLERRRRAADARLGTGHTGPAAAPSGDPTEGGPRVARNSLLAAAVLVSLLALAASLMPFGGGDGGVARADDARRPAAGPGVSLPPPPDTPSGTAPAAGTAPAPSAPGPSADRTTAPVPEREDPDPEPQGTSSGTAGPPPPAASSDGPAACRVAYDLVNQWPDGFQATLTVTTRQALDAWRVAFSFRDGQRVRQMWDATHDQKGARVTATAASYNGDVPANGRIAFGFIASWDGTNTPPHDITLNGRPCTPA
ncbi:cellulose binding domain-containing protein [Streptomyces sp. NPDC029526]|uniref:cellulose binding domain-containing protein n=1 Tax=Streptomyces sp. NPDC029526 TaxID=3155728 RepID=UPI0034087C32